jgi:soluble lytic murein transglycosylase-like protein
MAYLRWLLDHFNGDVKLALAGYNAGEKAVERYGGVKWTPTVGQLGVKNKLRP